MQFIRFNLSIIYWLIPFSLSILGTPGRAQPINGVEGLGQLRIDEVVFPGSHNAGAGFRSVLYTWSDTAVSSGFYRNQMLNFNGQLDSGARYFDIDTMWVKPGSATGDWWQPNGIWTGHGSAYAGPIDTVLQEVKDWMNRPANRNEVVILHFNNNIRKDGFSQDDTTQMANDLNRLLERNFPTNSGYVRLNTKSNNQWPTMAEAVSDNKRLFVFVNSRLYNATNSNSFLRRHTFKESASNVLNAYSGEGVSSDSGVKEVLLKNADEANSAEEFVRMSLMTGYGLEIGDMMEYANNHYKTVIDKAKRNRNNHNKVVNFLLVDRVGTGGMGEGENDINYIAHQLNSQRVARRAQATNTPTSTAAPADSTYTVTIKTGTKTGAGTDSNISIAIYGTNGATVPKILNPLISGDAFENDDTDTVTFTAKNVGNVTSVRISSDGKYAGSDWYLDKVTVKTDSEQKTFSYNDWIEIGSVILN